MITLIVMTDGRSGYLAQAMDSMHHLRGDVTRRVLHDDTGDVEHRSHLRRHYPGWDVIGPPRRAGFGGAYQSAWEWLAHNDDNRFVFSTEEDFVFTRDVDLAAMADVLTARPYLSQLALRRQAWNPVEEAAGGVVEVNPDAYTEVTDGATWLEHRLFHTTNPSLMRREFVAAHPWPNVRQSEGIFAHGLFTDPDIRAGYWGGFESGQWVEHIGEVRTGRGY